ncbi:metal-dependent hydrolase family protein [Peristeroidobacter soli]|uniref:metal-dependent hydrolase family protein n=1 Tax=Peristeroidobacter soli TaxID=2497877 RepID=UPI00101C1C2F|nr:amidohydrolase family protein [Peristeroidobacter soli]
MSGILFKNARVFDGTSEDCQEGMQVLVEGDRIREVSATPIKSADAHVIDVAGKTLMPGLIDAHIHVYASDVNIHKVDHSGTPYRTAHAIRMLRFALESGFTTVRDVGGGDWSLARAIDERLLVAPRFFYAGKALSMTGGHGDFREPGDSQHEDGGLCSCGHSNTLSVVADGLDECIKAAREELRRGAHCIKIMGSGGVASPSDPIWMNQYRDDEISAIVHEAQERRSYVTAHCHPAYSARRCVELGVRCIEHGTLMDDDTARFIAEKGAFVVPTMAVIFAISEMGKKLGFPAASQEKIEYARQRAIAGMESMRKAGVRVGFGTDLLGDTYVQERREFTLRSEVFSPVEILRQATSNNAAILQHEGKLGCVAPDAYADLIVVDGDPLKNLSLLAEGRHLSVIMRAGEFIRNDIN